MSESKVESSHRSQKFSFLAEYHTYIPALILSIMAVGFFMYWKAEPNSARFVLGKKFLVPFANLSLLLYFLLAIIVPLIIDYLPKRQEEIEEGIRSFEQQNSEIAQRYRVFKEKLEKIEDEEKAILEQANSFAKKEAEKIVQDAILSSEKTKDDAEKMAEQELLRVQGELRSKVIEQSFARAEVLLNEKISTQELERLDNEYLNQLGAIS